MTEVLFYHLERARLEHILPDLLEKSLQRGWRALVLAGGPDRVAAIDGLLWTYTDESFLPHGTGQGEDGDDHPVLIGEAGAEGVTLDGRDILFLVNGGEVAADSIGSLTRCIRIFDGGDPDAVDAARSFWKGAKAAGHDATYWRQSDQGRWEKQG